MGSMVHQPSILERLSGSSRKEMQSGKSILSRSKGPCSIVFVAIIGVMVNTRVDSGVKGDLKVNKTGDMDRALILMLLDRGGANLVKEGEDGSIARILPALRTR